MNQVGTRLVRLSALVLVGVLAVAGCSSSAGADPAPEVSVSDSGGSLVLGEGSELPADWPTDIPAPEELLLQSVIDSGNSATALYLGRGNATLIGQEVARKLTTNGYTAQSTTTEGFETTTTYTKASTTVALSISQTGTDASLTFTVTQNS